MNLIVFTCGQFLVLGWNGEYHFRAVLKFEIIEYHILSCFMHSIENFFIAKLNINLFKKHLKVNRNLGRKMSITFRFFALCRVFRKIWTHFFSGVCLFKFFDSPFVAIYCDVADINKSWWPAKTEYMREKHLASDRVWLVHF